MSKKFLLELPEREHQLLKLAAVQLGASMNTFIRDAISEKIARQQAATALSASDAAHNASAAASKAKDKPA